MSIPNDDKFQLTIKEIIGSKVDWDSLPSEIQQNLFTLRSAVSLIRKLYNKPLTVSSGLRTMEDHLRIYKAKGITDKSKIPVKSKHLLGAAVDIADPKQELQAFILKNKHLLEDCELWVEDFSVSRTWVHLQCQPFASWKPGKSRFFRP